jgi:two-component system, OmpR family, sensor histidine kinase KdpD
MKHVFLAKIAKPKQYLLSILIVCMVTVLCFSLSAYIEYRIVAFILLFTVSIIAMFFDMLPVLLAALLSALFWDFFFIPPRFTFQVGTVEDTVLLIMYFVIALLNGILTYKIRQFEKIALQKEEKANTVKLYNTLLNSLSHELRTPIATIIGATDNLQSNNSRLTRENKSELINQISKAAFRLNEQVENLLNMSRLESGFIQPNKDWVDIEELVYDVVKKIEENNMAQKIHINVNPAIPLFRLDKGMLEQVLYNLLKNACLYTKPGSAINIAAMGYEDLLEIIVEDNGQGFPEDEIKKVFDKFYRLKHTKAGGTGLGLSIARGFTEAQGGSIQLENSSTGGARFTIHIPGETSYLKNLKNE